MRFYPLDYYGEIYDKVKRHWTGDLEIGGLIVRRELLVGTQDNKDMEICHTKVINPKNEKAKGQILFVHGYIENSDFWIEAGIQFALNDFEVHLLDLRGFGLSGGERASNSLFGFQADLEKLLQQMRKDLPLFISGHSAGGLTVLSSLVNNPKLEVAGVLISASGFKSKEASWDRRILLRLFGASLSIFNMRSTMKPQELVGDSREMLKIYSNPKACFNVHITSYATILNTMDYLYANPKRFTKPIFFALGERDRIV